MLVHELRASFRYRSARHFPRSRVRKPTRGHRRGEGGVDSRGGRVGGLATQPVERARGYCLLLDVHSSGATLTPTFSSPTSENTSSKTFVNKGSKKAGAARDPGPSVSDLNRAANEAHKPTLTQSN